MHPQRWRAIQNTSLHNTSIQQLQITERKKKKQFKLSVSCVMLICATLSQARMVSELPHWHMLFSSLHVTQTCALDVPLQKCDTIGGRRLPKRFFTLQPTRAATLAQFFFHSTTPTDETKRLSISHFPLFHTVSYTWADFTEPLPKSKSYIATMRTVKRGWGGERQR